MAWSPPYQMAPPPPPCPPHGGLVVADRVVQDVGVGAAAPATAALVDEDPAALVGEVVLDGVAVDVAVAGVAVDAAAEVPGRVVGDGVAADVDVAVVAVDAAAVACRRVARDEVVDQGEVGVVAAHAPAARAVAAGDREAGQLQIAAAAHRHHAAGPRAADGRGPTAVGGEGERLSGHRDVFAVGAGTDGDLGAVRLAVDRVLDGRIVSAGCAYGPVAAGTVLDRHGDGVGEEPVAAVAQDRLVVQRVGGAGVDVDVDRCRAAGDTVGRDQAQ